MSPNPNPADFVGLLIALSFVAVMGWIIWLGWRRNRYQGPSEVTTAQQAMLARATRDYYLDPQFKLCNPETPTEFDQHLLSLLDSIEANRDDIDAKLEDLRVSLKGSHFGERFKDKLKLGRVYTTMAASLPSPQPERSRMAMQQMLANWRMVGRLSHTDTNLSNVPKAWIRPLTNDPVPPAGASGTRMRGVLILPAPLQILVGTVFLSGTGTMIVYAIRPNLPASTYVMWAAGIGVVYLLSVAFGFTKPYKRSPEQPARRS
jgi:hypothetical protein